MKKSYLKLVSPTEVNRTVTPKRRPNAELRTREHLTAGEIEALVEAAKANRHGHRDATMILVAFRHGLRAAELCRSNSAPPSSTSAGSRTAPPALVRSEVMNCEHRGGSSGRAIRRHSSFPASEAPRSRRPASARMIKRAAEGASLTLKAHPHMLRHACGHALANNGHDTRAI
jgi:site-specific recombinase XerD